MSEQNSDRQWSVWKNSGLKGQVWRSVCETQEEQYARHVFRHYVEDLTKMGYVQLRYEQEVIDEVYFPRIRKKNNPDTGESIKVTYDIFPGVKEIENLVAINPVLSEVYREFQQGNMDYHTMLSLAVQKLAK